MKKLLPIEFKKFEKMSVKMLKMENNVERKMLKKCPEGEEKVEDERTHVHVFLNPSYMVNKIEEKKGTGQFYKFKNEILFLLSDSFCFKN